ncbi:hypothetical protein K1719_013628 [Acacia pycnantha]|nr:hypothetical protein K1719_013628 [Acacia pycnantha]
MFALTPTWQFGVIDENGIIEIMVRCRGDFPWDIVCLMTTANPIFLFKASIIWFSRPFDSEQKATSSCYA